jgi:hypothetical protein
MIRRVAHISAHALFSLALQASCSGKTLARCFARIRNARKQTTTFAALKKEGATHWCVLAAIFTVTTLIIHIAGVSYALTLTLTHAAIPWLDATATCLQRDTFWNPMQHILNVWIILVPLLIWIVALIQRAAAPPLNVLTAS